MTLEIVWRARVSEKNGGQSEAHLGRAHDPAERVEQCVRGETMAALCFASFQSRAAVDERGPATTQPLLAAQAEMPPRAPYAGRLAIMNSGGEGPSSFCSWDTKLSLVAPFFALIARFP